MKQETTQVKSFRNYQNNYNEAFRYDSPRRNVMKERERGYRRKIMDKYAQRAAKDLALLEEKRKIDEQTRQRLLDNKMEQEVYERSRQFQRERNERHWDLILSLTRRYKGC